MKIDSRLGTLAHKNRIYPIAITRIENVKNRDVDLLKKYLSLEELETWAALKAESRQLSFAMGRFCAKQAIAKLRPETIPEDIHIASGAFGQPLIQTLGLQDLAVSISHTINAAIAVAFLQELPIGIDIEHLDLDRIRVIEQVLDEDEKTLHQDLAIDRPQFLALCWTAKEALGKTIKIGFFGKSDRYRIREFQKWGEHHRIYFHHFYEFVGISIKVNQDRFTIVAPSSAVFSDHFF